MSLSPSGSNGCASLMVQLDLREAAPRRVALAASLAARLGARLVGIAAEPLILPYLGDGAALDSMLVEDARLKAGEHLAQAEATFRTHGGGQGEWRSAIEPARDFILDQSRVADLLVVGRQDPADAAGSAMAVAPADLVLALGRPLLVVPPQVDSLAAKNVVIAWKNSREARRAVSDALPFLKQAELVTVVSLGAEADEQGADDVAHHLGLHGISARTVLRRHVDGYLTDELIDFAGKQGADLIVSGAYGRGRVQEWLFGGVTRELLQGSPVCCLMSH